MPDTITQEKNWYNPEQVKDKGSVVLREWNATKSPTALKKAQSMPMRRGFSAARVDRLTASWLASTNSINQELKSDLDRLRARARDLTKNNEYARKFKKIVVSNMAGPLGFLFQGRVMNTPEEADKLANDALEGAFEDWSRRGVCEISGKMSFKGLCQAVLGGLPSDGEYLVRRIKGSAARNEYGYALQLIDIDRLDTTYNENVGSNGNAIVMGVEMDAYRRPLFYHILTSHPSETGTARKRERVPADQILHDFLTEHAEQVRGVPWMSASILSLHHLGRFEESALLAARKGADTLGFFVSPDGSAPDVGGGEGEGEDPITVSVPGSYDTLPEGYDFRAYDSKYPDAILADFNKYFLRRISTGFNVAYNGLGNDLEGVNFSSIRSGVIDERDQWMLLQEWFIESFLIPIYNDWLESALLMGAIKLPNGTALPASRLSRFRSHTWQGRRWQWVDPVKDIEAARLAVRSGVSSPQHIAAQMGMDIEDVMADLRRFEDMSKGIGLIDYEIKQPAPQAKQQEADDGAAG
jgi:lambda family phage portal protein